MKQNNTLVQKLREEAKRNPVFKDIMHMLAQRQRTRGRLTVTRLKQAMEEEGFNYSRQEYENVIRFLGLLGLGNLSESKRGKAKGLSGIKIKLQSIGQAALTQNETLKPKREQNRYENIVAETETVHAKDFIEAGKPVVQAKATTTKPNDIRRTTRPYPAFLTVLIDGKPVNIPGPSSISAENVGEFIAEFSTMVKEYKGEA